MSLPGKQKWPRALRGAPRTLLSDSGNRKKKRGELDWEENFVKISKPEKDSDRIFYETQLSRDRQRKDRDEYFLSYVKNISKLAYQEKRMEIIAGEVGAGQWRGERQAKFTEEKSGITCWRLTRKARLRESWTQLSGCQITSKRTGFQVWTSISQASSPCKQVRGEFLQ